jgi:hypothetical protein
METTTTIWKLQAGDTVSILGHPFRTVESIRRGWTGNHRAAQRSIRIRYTNGEGSVFTNASVPALVRR